MAFTEDEIRNHLDTLEKAFWVKRRPPFHLRDRICEGQRVQGQSIELFFVRPTWNDPSQTFEEAIAKITYVSSRDSWRLLWKRADGKWHSYPECREAGTLEEALRVVDQDAMRCFFG